MMMDKGRGLIISISIFIMIVNIAAGKGKVGNHKLEEQESEPSFIRPLASLLYVSTTSAAATTSKWEKIKVLVNQAHAYFFPPNIDFRKGGDEGDESERKEGGGGEKMKEAFSKSLEKCLEDMEESAKSAAKVATETVHITKDKVINTLSAKPTTDHHQSDSEL